MAGQDVEARRLARAVGPHDARELALLELERDVLEDHLVAEALAQVVCFKQSHWGLLGRVAAQAARWPTEDCGAASRLPRAGDAFGLEEHHHHEEQAVPEEPRLGERAEQVAGHDEDQRRR